MNAPQPKIAQTARRARKEPLRPRLRSRLPVLRMSLNLTPMIDVVFNLLLFFLVLSRFEPREGMLPARLPSDAAAAPATELPRTPVRVRLAADPASPADCRVTIDRFNESPMPFRALGPALRRIRLQEPGFDHLTPVHLIADDDVAWDHVVNAYNAALAAEYERIFFAGAP